jgi:hypothetical protein
MLYQLAMLLLHHPFQLGLLPGQHSVLQSAAVGGNTETRLAYIAAAVHVCRCIDLYRRHYGLKRIFVQAVYITLTAGMVFAEECHSSLSTEDERRSSQEHALTCIQALGEMGQTYRSAIQGIYILTTACYEGSGAAIPEPGTSQLPF